MTIHDHAPGLILRLVHFCKFGRYFVTPLPGFYEHRPEQARLLLDTHVLPPPFCDSETAVKPEHAVVNHAMMLNLGDAFHMPLLEQYASNQLLECFRNPSVFWLASI